MGMGLVMGLLVTDWWLVMHLCDLPTNARLALHVGQRLVSGCVGMSI
jgi:hypothetical protein